MDEVAAILGQLEKQLRRPILRKTHSEGGTAVSAVRKLVHLHALHPSRTMESADPHRWDARVVRTK
jgi:hypothetical protein